MRDVTLDDNYMVDREGNIYSKRRKMMLTPKRNHDGYLRIQLWNKQKCRYLSIHRLVLMAFDPRDSYEGLVTNHKNGIKDDNRLENLEWMTQSENIQHAIKTGLIDVSKRKNGPSTSVSVHKYEGDKLINTYPSMSEAERTTGIPRHTITASCDRGKLIGDYRFERNETCND